MALPGETEAGSAGKQPCPGIVRRAHRDDDHGRGNERLAPTLHPIGSKDPDALKIPARRAASTLTRSVRSPVLAEPAQVRQGNRTQAIKHFQFVLSINPKDLAANRELALSLSRVGRSEEALTYFSKVVALAPDDETSLISLSSLLVSENRDRQARDLLDQAHRRFPNRGRTTHALARLLAACPDAGVCDGDRALKLALQVYRSTQFVAHGETVAMALAQVGRCQEAAEWQRRMVAAAERANEPALATRLQQQVVRYERNRPCAPRSSRRQSPP